MKAEREREVGGGEAGDFGKLAPLLRTGRSMAAQLTPEEEQVRGGDPHAPPIYICWREGDGRASRGPPGQDRGNDVGLEG